MKVINISSGVANYPEQAKDVKESLEVVDNCLYEAKNSGRNRTITCKNKNDKSAKFLT